MIGTLITAHDRQHRADAIGPLHVIDGRSQPHVAQELHEQHQLEDDARIPLPVRAPHGAAPKANRWRARTP